MRDFQTRRLGELRANRDENAVRGALNRIERSAALSEDDENNANTINNSNNCKNEDGNVRGRRIE